MKEISMKDIEVRLDNVIVAYTTQPEYEMNRYFLLEGEYRQHEGRYQHHYIVVDGYHCSCYNFDETDWTAIEYPESELETLAQADYNYEGDVAPFWKQVRIALSVEKEE